MEDIVRLSNLIDAPAPTACPGCGHLLFFRLIREVLDELDLTEKAIHANGIGCTVSTARGKITAIAAYRPRQSCRCSHRHQAHKSGSICLHFSRRW